MNYTKELALYDAYLQEKELAEQTRKIYLAQTKKFLDYMNGRTVTKRETLAYKKLLMEQGKKLSTINLQLTAVNGYLKYTGYADCTVKTQKQQRRPSKENLMTAAEYKKLLAWAKESGREKYYCIMRTLALTGIRISELSGCSVEALEIGKFTAYNKGKCREIYLPPKLITDLREYCRKKAITEGVIFRGSADAPISRIAVYKMLIKLADDLGMPKGKVHPHNFRHLFAVTYMQKYFNLLELADLLGHSSLETTRIYTAITGEEKRQKINKLEL